MISDVMGNDDYGDYGEEEGAAFKREGEAEHDFMWLNQMKNTVDKYTKLSTFDIKIDVN